MMPAESQRLGSQRLDSQRLGSQRLDSQRLSTAAVTKAESQKLNTGPDSIYVPPPPPPVHDPYPPFYLDPEPKRSSNSIWKILSTIISMLLLAAAVVAVVFVVKSQVNNAKNNNITGPDSTSPGLPIGTPGPAPMTCTAPNETRTGADILRDIIAPGSSPGADTTTVQAKSLNPQFIPASHQGVEAQEDKTAIIVRFKPDRDPILKAVESHMGSSNMSVDSMKPEDIWSVITTKLHAKNGMMSRRVLTSVFSDMLGSSDVKLLAVITSLSSSVKHFYYSPYDHSMSLYMSSEQQGEAVMQLLKKLPEDWLESLEFAYKDKMRADFKVLPNDPLFMYQWALPRIGVAPSKNLGAPNVWSVTRGSKNVVVAILDSGVDYRHKDLKDNLWVNPGEIPDNGIDDDNNGYVDDVYGFNFFSNSPDVDDDHGHGTHVAGIVGAVGNDGYGVIGVSPLVSLMTLKVLDSQGEGNTAIQQVALDYAMMMKAHITSNSYGSLARAEGQSGTFKELEKQGILFVAAAGNERRDNDVYPIYPASFKYNNILSVASADQGDCISGFSNYGKREVDLAAPGSNIYSCAASTPTELAGREHIIMDGTSMSTPFVAGVAALMLSVYEQQNLTMRGRGETLAKILLSSVDTFDSMKNHLVTGGRLNAARAVKQLQDSLTASTSPTSSAFFLAGILSKADELKRLDDVKKAEEAEAARKAEVARKEPPEGGAKELAEGLSQVPNDVAGGNQTAVGPENAGGVLECSWVVRLLPVAVMVVMGMVGVM